MLKQVCYFCLLCIPLLLMGCKDDKPDTPEAEPLLTLEYTTLSFVAEGESKTVDVTSNGKWNAVSSESWCTLSQSTGEGNISLSITVTQNTGLNTRSAKISFKQGGISKDITVSQLGEAPDILLDEKPLTLTTDAGAFELTITTNVKYDVLIADDWISSIETRTMIEYTHRFVYTQNMAQERTSTITFKEKDGKLAKSVQIIQEGISHPVYTLESFKELTECGTYISGEFTLGYIAARHQLTFSAARRSMRVQTFNQETLAAVTLSAMPSKEGEDITISYTNITNSITEKKEITAQVVSIADNKAWLWNEEHSSGFIVATK